VNETKQKDWVQHKLVYRSCGSVGCYIEVLQDKDFLFEIERQESPHSL
jgi:hypothetical protein